MNLTFRPPTVPKMGVVGAQWLEPGPQGPHHDIGRLAVDGRRDIEQVVARDGVDAAADPHLDRLGREPVLLAAALGAHAQRQQRRHDDQHETGASRRPATTACDQAFPPPHPARRSLPLLTGQAYVRESDDTISILGCDEI